MSDRKIILGSTLTAIANAIRAKLGTTKTYLPSEMADAIAGISTGTDVSDTTAAASDVMSGKQFYTADGEKTQGSLAITSISPANSNPPAVSSGKNYKPSSSGYLISSYQSRALYASASGTQANSGWNYLMSGCYVYAPKPSVIDVIPIFSGTVTASNDTATGSFTITTGTNSDRDVDYGLVIINATYGNTSGGFGGTITDVAVTSSTATCTAYESAKDIKIVNGNVSSRMWTYKVRDLKVGDSIKFSINGRYGRPWSYIFVQVPQSIYDSANLKCFGSLYSTTSKIIIPEAISNGIAISCRHGTTPACTQRLSVTTGSATLTPYGIDYCNSAGTTSGRMYSLKNYAASDNLTNTITTTNSCFIIKS